MSQPLRAVATVAVLAGLAVSGACASSGQRVDAGAAATLGGTPPLGDTSACDEVVAGIEAFNRGELDETVASFERALPLAEAEDAAAGTRRSADLLEAVRYYAALPAEDYPEASLSSPDFATYQRITLGQCGSGQPQVPGAPDEGVPA